MSEFFYEFLRGCYIWGLLYAAGMATVWVDKNLKEAVTDRLRDIIDGAVFIGIIGAGMIFLL